VTPVDALQQPVTLPLWLHWLTLAYSTRALVQWFDLRDRFGDSGQ